MEVVDIVEVIPLPDNRLHLRFENGVEGEVNVSEIVVFTGVFEPLKDQEFFATAHVDTEMGTVVWPNGADLDPLTLYAKVIQLPLSEIENELGGPFQVEVRAFHESEESYETDKPE